MHHHPAANRDLEELRSQQANILNVPELEDFVGRGWITSIHATLTSGKEATVYCCRAHPSTRRKFLAAKVYREHAARSIRRGVYFEGRERRMKARELRAVANGSAFGHRVMAGVWMSEEYECLKRLSEIGAPVPAPRAMADRVILMDYLGNGAAPAPHLDGVAMEPETARNFYAQVVEFIELALSEHLVHGDLSPYNILVWQQQPWIIDLPQAVDARFNRNAFELLRRDLVNVCTFFEKHGVACNPHQTAVDLWSRYQRANL